MLTQARPEHRFSVALERLGADGWNAVPPDLDRLGQLGVWGVAITADGLGPPDVGPRRRCVMSTLAEALNGSGLCVSAVTIDLAGHRAFSRGALAAGDREVRRFALQQAVRAVDLAAELGARTCVLSSEPGTDAALTGRPLDALARYREAIEFLRGHVRDRDLRVRLALETASTWVGEPALLPTVANALAFVAALDAPDAPDRVGLDVVVGPFSAQDPAIHPSLVQVIAAGALVQVDVSPPACPRSEWGRADLAFATSFRVVKLLEEVRFDGPLHLGGAPSCPDSWDRVRASMRSYEVMAAKARRYHDDPDIQDALAGCGTEEWPDATIGPFSPTASRELDAERLDPPPADHDHARDRLDRLVTDLILGLR